MTAFLSDAPRFLFFTGKGGVGKTSLACASALVLADAGRRVLLVSTDPASNLDEVLATPLAQTPTPVRNVPGLDALNIDPQAAAADYRERIVGPYRNLLPPATVSSIEEQLSGACTVEIASFNEFTRLIGDESAIAAYDHVILDTAPTGHTLRLLALPAAWNDFIAGNKSGSSCLGPLAGLKEQRQVYEKTVNTLTDSARTLLVLVSRADSSTLQEAARASNELALQGMANQHLILNGLFFAGESQDATALAFDSRTRAALSTLPDILRKLPRTEITFHPSGLSGLAALRQTFKTPPEPPAQTTTPGLKSFDGLLDLDELVDRLAEDGPGAILTMGKGGVGKTTLAIAIAQKLAARGYTVHLTTTDPAGRISQDIGAGHPNLSIGRIDPATETKAHIEQTLATSGVGLDAEALALLEEELRSPCTEEVAIFQAFSREIAKGKNQFVVLDTAPTGHTLLLLDATEAYHREVLHSTNTLPEAVRQLLPRLRDPRFTRVLIVTLPEATPVHEAAALQKDLRRAGIEPMSWIINQSLAGTGTRDPRLQHKAQHELTYIQEAITLSTRRVLVPWVSSPNHLLQPVDQTNLHP